MILGSTYPFLSDGGAASADDELLGSCCEAGETANGKVFMVEVGVVVNGIIGLSSIVSEFRNEGRELVL